MDNLIGNYSQFIAQASDNLAQLGIARNEVAMMDHVCYRVETVDRYEELKAALQVYTTLIGENMVNGRPIATFELNTYMEAAGWTVPFLELPAPKQDSPYVEGLEHVEFVVIGSLNKFILRHSAALNISQLSQKIVNPDVKALNSGVTIKFHEQQLGAVVRIERDVLDGESR